MVSPVFFTHKIYSKYHNIYERFLFVFPFTYSLFFILNGVFLLFLLKYKNANFSTDILSVLLFLDII